MIALLIWPERGESMTSPSSLLATQGQRPKKDVSSLLVAPLSNVEARKLYSACPLQTIIKFLVTLTNDFPVNIHFFWIWNDKSTLS